MSSAAFSAPAKVCLSDDVKQSQRCERRRGREGRRVGKARAVRRVADSGTRMGTTCISAPPTPVKERSKTTPQVAKPQLERETKQPEQYRLYIYNDPFNKRERVVDVLLKTCAGLTFSRAYAAMQEAHETGRGLVLVVAQEIAEHYCACILSGLYICVLLLLSRSRNLQHVSVLDILVHKADQPIIAHL